MWQFQRKYQIPKFKEVKYDGKIHSKKIKNILIKEFNSTCYFTDIVHSQKTHEDIRKYNIEHFIPQSKDKTTHKYDFMQDNLFLADADWNSWKGNNVETSVTEETFQLWLSFIYDFDNQFEFKLFPNISPEIAKILKLKQSFGEIRITGKTAEASNMIQILQLNSYNSSGRIGENLSHKRYLKQI